MPDQLPWIAQSGLAMTDEMPSNGAFDAQQSQSHSHFKEAVSRCW